MLQSLSAYTLLYIHDIGIKIACQVSGSRQIHESCFPIYYGFPDLFLFA